MKSLINTSMPAALEMPAKLQEVISEALRLQPTFARPQVLMWSKIIAAAVEPLISDSMSPVPGPCQPDTAVEIENAAVASFCEYLLSSCDEEQRPNEHMLQELAAGWMKERGQSTNSQEATS